MDRSDVFEKKVCRLCETRERHTAGIVDGWVEGENSYWLDKSSKFIEGTAFNGKRFARFTVPVRFCPFCGKEL